MGCARTDFEMTATELVITTFVRLLECFRRTKEIRTVPRRGSKKGDPVRDFLRCGAHAGFRPREWDQPREDAGGRARPI